MNVGAGSFIETPKETVYHIDGQGEVVGFANIPKPAQDAIIAEYLRLNPGTKRLDAIMAFDEQLYKERATALDISMRGSSIVSITSSSLQAQQAAAATGQLYLTLGGPRQTVVFNGVQVQPGPQDQLVPQGVNSSAGGAYITNPDVLNSANGQDMAGGFNWTNLKRDMAPGDGAKLETLMKSLDPNKMSVEQYNAAIGQINGLFSKNYIDISINPATVEPATASSTSTQTNITTVITPVLNARTNSEELLGLVEFNFAQKETTKIESAYYTSPDGKRVEVFANGSVQKENIAAMRLNADQRGVFDAIVGVIEGPKDSPFFGVMATLVDSGTVKADGGLLLVNGKLLPTGSFEWTPIQSGDFSASANFELKGQRGMVPGAPATAGIQFTRDGHWTVGVSAPVKDLDQYSINVGTANRSGGNVSVGWQPEEGAGWITLNIPSGGGGGRSKTEGAEAPVAQPQPVVVQNSKFWEQFIEAS
jgi:hypothetical protein